MDPRTTFVSTGIAGVTSLDCFALLSRYVWLTLRRRLTPGAPQPASHLMAMMARYPIIELSLEIDIFNCLQSLYLFSHEGNRLFTFVSTSESDRHIRLLPKEIAVKFPFRLITRPLHIQVSQDLRYEFTYL